MISSVSIENLRGIEKGQISGLSPLSIIVGPNNSGKSTCLEALAIPGIAFDPEALKRLLLRRGGSVSDALTRIVRYPAEEAKIDVRAGDPSNAVTVTFRASRQGPFNLKVIVRPTASPPADLEFGANSSIFGTSSGRPPWSTRFVDVEVVREKDSLENAYTDIENAKQLPDVIRALKTSMPKLAELKILKVGDSFMLHTIREDERPVPAYLAGDGLKRFLQIAAQTLAVGRGVAILEEPESFQHPRYLRELATLLLGAARTGTQIILSTHSIELIDLLLHGSSSDEAPPEVSVHRLRLIDGNLSSVRLSAEDARIGRDELLEDLRA